MASFFNQFYKALAKTLNRPADLQIANAALAESRARTLFADWHIASSQAVPVNTDLPNITICAVTFNSAKWLENFWQSLCTLTYPKARLSVHFVDHGSADGTLASLNRFAAQTELGFSSVKIDKRPNTGYGAGNDFAIRQSKDDFVLVTNVDVEVYPDSLAKIAVVAAGDDANVASWEFRQCPYEHPKYYDPVTQLSNWASHACVLIRRSAYIKVGGYDQNIFMYGEDVELSYRFRNEGWHLRYVPKAIIRHHVDLQDLSSRPHQLSGSIAANRLLRRKYGTRRDRVFGCFLMWFLRVRVKEPSRKMAFSEASKIYKRKRSNFNPVPRKATRVSFQFDKFYYGFRRQGATLPHTPDSPSKSFSGPKVKLYILFEPPLSPAFIETVTTAMNQTYENTEYVIVGDTSGNHGDFFDKLEKTYADKITFENSAQELWPFEPDTYLCWLEAGDLLFADHVEILTVALVVKREALAAQSYGWSASGKELLSQTLILRSNCFGVEKQPVNIADIKRKIAELKTGNSKRLIFVPKTTSIVRPVI